MKTKLFIMAIALGIIACGGGQSSGGDNFKPTPTTGAAEKPADGDERGIGPIKDVKLSNPLETALLTTGEDVYKVKCAACHRLNEEKLVGPGWKDVTKRHKPEWIMNFTVNVDEMLNKDPKAIAMLEECLVRMPNQNLTEKDARSVLEFMRKNDGEK